MRYDKAVEFLERFHPGGPWVPCAIPKEGGTPVVATFSRREDMLAWLMERGETHNLYLHVNPMIGELKSKARLTDVKVVLYLHLDSDVAACPPHETDPAAHLKREQERILRAMMDAEPRPNVVVFSGGGYQAYWRLEDAIVVDGDEAAAREATLYNKGLVQKFAGSDSCQSVDHVMRLPFTTNWPDAKKRKKNPAREPVMADVVHWDDGTWPLSAFKKATEGRTSSGKDEAAPRYVARVDVDLAVPRVESFETDLRLKNVPDWVKALIVSGQCLDKKFESRSEAQWACSCALVRAGVDDQLHFALLTDPDLYLGQCVLTDGKGRARKGVKRYALKQIEDAHEANEAEAKFVRDDDERIVKSYDNVEIALKALGVSLRFDEFSGSVELEGLENFGPDLEDEAVVRVVRKISRTYFFTPTKEMTEDTMKDVARANSFHPVQDYLSGLKWDGVRRIDSWLATYCGASADAYTSAVGSIFLRAAAKRILEPGTKFDQVLILQGAQGLGKSTVVSTLAKDERWFVDDVPFKDAKLLMEITAGAWICELAELATMQGRDAEHVKALISRRRDKARMAYRKNAANRPRQFVLVGTTNDEEFLTDPTGARRFWPVRLGPSLNLEGLKADVDQLWAEAVARQGETIELDASLWPEAAGEQEEHRVKDPWEEALASKLEGLTGSVKALDLYAALDLPTERQTLMTSKRVGAIMRKLQFKYKDVRLGRWRGKCWVRGEHHVALNLAGGKFVAGEPF